MNKSKIIKTAKALDKLFRISRRIIFILAIVTVALLCILTIMNMVNPNSVIGSDFNIVHIGPLMLELAEEYAPNNNAILIYCWIVAAEAAAIIGVLCYSLGVIRKILAPMTQGNPFHPAVGKEIRKLAFASLAIGIIQNIMSVAEVLNVLNIFDLNALIQDSQVNSITSNFHLDLNFIVVFFVLLLISYIFHYGEELQKLSDETL